ncbi:MAG: carboxylesterase family protein, partial [Clostridia bacterium]|nr:carboxylesterase family protein [Clostridia bacterium]
PSTIGRRPVMVFIHGGAFITGSGSQYIYDGQNFADKGVVVVTFNYRMGALGMFNFSFIDKDFAANLALRDQLMALEWVYENIEGFGGNAEDITVCGQSAGAISLTCLLSVPEAKPYIKKAIVISSFPDIINSREQSINIAEDFLKFIGIEEPRAKEKLLAMDAAELTEHTKAFTKNCRRKNGLDLLMPCVDGEFLPEKPLTAVKNGNAHYVPLLIGVTKSEVDILFRLKGFKSMATKELECLLEEEHQIKEELLAAYGELPAERAYPLIGRDWLIRIPSEWYAKSHSQRATVWMYRFDYENLFLKLTGMHSVHALDLLFAFKNFDNIIGRVLFSLTPVRAKAMELADRLQEDIINFIKTGSSPWQPFDGGYAVKVYDAAGDRLETDEKDAVREIWQKTEIYKKI